MFLVQMEGGHTIPIKIRQFLRELKDYIEESNDEVTLGRVLSKSISTVFSKNDSVKSSMKRRKNLP